MFRCFRLCLVATLGLSLAIGGEEIRPDVLITKKYRLAPYIVAKMIAESRSPNPPVDPFNRSDPASQKAKPDLKLFDIKNRFTDYGMEFPAGTHCVYDSETRILEIRHGPSQIAYAEEILDREGESEYPPIGIRLEIYQMPAKAAVKVQQLCGPETDHTAVWESIQGMVDRGQASVVSSMATIGRSGQRTQIKAVQEAAYPTSVEWDKTKEVVIPVGFETTQVGTVMEVDPVIGADNFTVDLNLSVEHHTAPPTMKPVAVKSPKTGSVVAIEVPEFHRKQLATQLTMSNNSVRCIASWRPTGKAEFEKKDQMQVAFLKVDLQKPKPYVIDGDE